MQRPVLCLVLVLAVSTMACEHASGGPMSAPGGPSSRTYRPDPGYQMSYADRDKVMNIFDVNALQRLISMLPPEHRAEVLSHFQYPDGDAAPPPPKLVSFDDPSLQAVLEEVWVPYWFTLPPSALHTNSRIPGRQLALLRLQAGQ